MKLHKSIILAALIAVIALLAFPGCSSKKKDSASSGSSNTTPTPTNTGGGDDVIAPGSGNADEQAVFSIVNSERSSNGSLPPLQWCSDLYALAKAHSNDMCERGFFDHTNPEGEGPTERGQYGHAGRFTFSPVVPDPYTWGVGENIAYGYTTPAQVMNGWMNSPGHRANILNSEYTHIGVGQCDFCRTHWTQNFGTR